MIKKLLMKRLLLVLLMCAPCWAQNDFTGDANCVAVWDGEYGAQHSWVQFENCDNQVYGSNGTRLSFAGDDVTLASFYDRIQTGWIYQDYGAGYFNGDVTFTVKFNCTALISIPSFFSFLTLRNVSGVAGGDGYGITDSSDDAIRCVLREDAGDVGALLISVYENGSSADSDTTEDTYGIALSQDYYITVTRDYDGGSNSTGLYTMYVCQTNYYGEAGADLKDTLSVESSAGEQNDYRYLYVAMSADNNVNEGQSTVYSDFKMDGASLDPNFDYEWPLNALGGTLKPVNNWGAEPNSTIFQEGAYSIDNTNPYAGLMYSASAFDMLKSADPQTFSLALWFRMKDTAVGRGDDETIAGRHYSATNGSTQWWLYVSDSDDHLKLRMTRDDGTGVVTADLNHDLYADTWYHVGVTLDNTSNCTYNIRLYDTNDTTVYTASATNAAGLDVDDARLFGLGTASYNRGEVASRDTFDGYIDEAAVFNDILTADEIDEIRNGTYGASTGPIEGNAFQMYYNPN